MVCGTGVAREARSEMRYWRVTGFGLLVYCLWNDYARALKWRPCIARARFRSLCVSLQLMLYNPAILRPHPSLHSPTHCHATVPPRRSPSHNVPLRRCLLFIQLIVPSPPPSAKTIALALPSLLAPPLRAIPPSVLSIIPRSRHRTSPRPSLRLARPLLPPREVS